MPIKSCQKDGKSGYKWGDSGKCYTYEGDNEKSRKNAREKARKQGIRIELEKRKRGEKSEFDKASILCVTSFDDNHQHTFHLGDTLTSINDGHIHIIDEDGNILMADGHTHEPFCPELEN